MTHTNANRPLIESLEGRLLLDGAPTDISLDVPAKMYEGKTVVIPTQQPDNYDLRIRFWEIEWGDNTPKTVKWRGSEPLQHTYAKYGSYPVTVTGERRNHDIVTFIYDGVEKPKFVVQNVTPAPSIQSFANAVPNQPVAITFNPGDSAPLDTLQVSWSIVGQHLGIHYTSASEAIAQSVSYTFTKSGKYTVKLLSKDKAGLVGTTTRTIRIAPVVIQSDAANPSLANIVVGGTNGNDIISFRERLSAVEVFLNGKSYGVFSNSAKIMAFGGAGNDVIAADATIDQPVSFHGGTGNDTLAGGSSTNELDVGSGTKNKIIRP